MTSEERIERLDEETAKLEAEKLGLSPLFAFLPVFRVWLGGLRIWLAKDVAKLLETLLRGDHLHSRLRERTKHWRVARSMGIPEEVLFAVRGWPQQPGFETAERAVLAATD